MIGIAGERATFLVSSLASWKPFPDTNAALERLRDAGYQLGILSNIDDELIRDALEKGISGRGELKEKDVLDREHPRWKLPSERPVRCTP